MVQILPFRRFLIYFGDRIFEFVVVSSRIAFRLPDFGFFMMC